MPFNISVEKLDLDRTPKGYIVHSEVAYWEKGLVVQIETPFICDLASIPSWLRWVVSNDDPRIWLPAIIHDWCYMHQGIIKPFKYGSRYIPRKVYSRSQCDRFFYSGLRDQSVSYMKSQLMWLGVRAGGWKPWNEKG